MFLVKIYVWSIVFEVLAYFVLPNYFFGLGVTLGYGKILQFLVLLILIFHIFDKNRPIIISNYDLSSYKPYAYFIIYSTFIGIISYLNGGYNSHQHLSLEAEASKIRPFIEYIIAIYQFFYFVILFKYIIRSRGSLNYFFKIFSRMFYLSLVLGILSLVLMFAYPAEFEGIPRAIFSNSTAGFRFNGLFGEPRSAVGFLILGAAILWLKDVWLNEVKLTKFVLLTIILALLFTKSTSGLIGIIFSFGLILLYYVSYTKIKDIAIIISSLILLSLIVILAISYEARVGNYYKSLIEMYAMLSSGESLNRLAKLYAVNIFPIWHRFNEILSFNIIPTFFGTGLGSSSIINSFYYAQDAGMTQSSAVLNPNANLIRMFYDVGIFGMLLLVASFINPIKKIQLPESLFSKLFIIMLIILGAYFAHRSIAPFIFLGTALVTLKNLDSKDIFK